MPDITMCDGGDCPLKQNCYRYLATPSEFRQSYFVNLPYDKQEDTCQHFWDNSLYNQIKNENKITD